MPASPQPVAHGFGLADLVIDRSLASPEALDRAMLVQAETGERLESVITRLGLVSEQALAEAIVAHGFIAAAANDYPERPVAEESLSPAFLREMRAVPLKETDDALLVAVVDPFQTWPLQAIGFAARRRVEPRIARAGDLDSALDRLYPRPDIEDAVEGEAAEADLERLKDMSSDAPVVRSVNGLIARAAEAQASDIHVEPTEDGLRVRLRIDGLLQDVDPPPAAFRTAFVSRIKVMAGLNIAERRLPQDGRMRVAVRGHEIDLRVATSPGIHGESVVMRILDRSGLALDFDALGFDPDLLERFRQVLHQPHGIVLVTGPTGSGKTTTLYTALAELNAPQRKVLTIEDPIEYRLTGITQTQVSPAIGLSFATALRSFLRQDPDVMMVGEIRDLETAQVAVQAALTGHMILSTLHTNSAAAAVVRLIDMGVEPFLIASTLTAVLAQRLVRRLCPHCRQPHPPTAVELHAFRRFDAGRPPRQLFRAGGCEACGHSGYRGRLAIVELLVVDETISRLILAGATQGEIRQQAATRTMADDGLAKAAAGLTTLDEVLRVTRDA